MKRLRKVIITLDDLRQRASYDVAYQRLTVAAAVHLGHRDDANQHLMIRYRSALEFLSYQVKQLGERSVVEIVNETR